MSFQLKDLTILDEELFNIGFKPKFSLNDSKFCFYELVDDFYIFISYMDDSLHLSIKGRHEGRDFGITKYYNTNRDCFTGPEFVFYKPMDKLIDYSKPEFANPPESLIKQADFVFNCVICAFKNRKL
jgi:hypothetical protein